MQHQSKTILFAFAALLLVSCGSLKPQTEAQYTRAIRNDMPFKVAELTLLKPDIYTFSCDGYV
ncbi:MAG: hypothetical protein K6A36_01555, partial [Paludibacteraceae bacterium]|nr:hypothetical protein [Paludibacteraceae bacterium]